MTQRPSSHPRQRAAFTLVEVLLVLSLMVAIAAMAWPKMMSMFDGQRLRSAADQVRTACFNARTDAINSGEIQALHFQPGTNAYSIDDWEDESLAQTGQSSAPASGGDETAQRLAPREGRLPDGIMFNAGSLGVSGPSLPGFGGAAGSAATPGGVVSGDSASASASVADFSGGNSSGSGGDRNGACLLFYPDGTASTSQILLENGDHRVLAIEVRGLTGDATVSDAPLPPEALR